MAVNTGVRQQLDKVTKVTTSVHTETASLNLYSGSAPSTQTGAEVLVISASTAEPKQIKKLILDLSNIQAKANVTIRMYETINGVEVECYNETFVRERRPRGVLLIDGDYAMVEDLRVEVQSSKSADTAVVIPYHHIIESLTEA